MSIIPFLTFSFKYDLIFNYNYPPNSGGSSRTSYETNTNTTINQTEQTQIQEIPECNLKNIKECFRKGDVWIFFVVITGLIVYGFYRDYNLKKKFK